MTLSDLVMKHQQSTETARMNVKWLATDVKLDTPHTVSIKVSDVPMSKIRANIFIYSTAIRAFVTPIIYVKPGVLFQMPTFQQHSTMTTPPEGKSTYTRSVFVGIFLSSFPGRVAVVHVFTISRIVLAHIGFQLCTILSTVRVRFLPSSFCNH